MATKVNKMQERMDEVAERIPVRFAIANTDIVVYTTIDSYRMPKRTFLTTDLDQLVFLLTQKLRTEQEITQKEVQDLIRLQEGRIAYENKVLRELQWYSR